MTEIISKAKWHGVTACAFLTFFFYALTVFGVVSVNTAGFPIVIRQAFIIIKTSCRLLFYFIVNLISHWDSSKRDNLNFRNSRFI